MKLYPSMSDIWVKCPAQPSLSKDLPRQEQSDSALEGTCASWLAEMVLTKQVKKCSDLLGKTSPDGWIVDIEMVNYIQEYVDFINGFEGDHSTETYIKFDENVGGKPDHFISTNSHIFIIDLKYGYKIVEPFCNQLTIYACALQKMYPNHAISTCIFQPRAFHPSGHVRKWHPAKEDLKHFSGQFEQAIQRCLGNNPQAHTGRHCKFCPAVGRCSAVSQEIYEFGDQYAFMGGRLTRQPNAGELARELAYAVALNEMISAHCKALSTELTQRKRSGEYIPGWTFKSGYGRRVWNRDPDHVKLLTGFDITKTINMTPSDAEKAGMNPEILRLFSEPSKTKTSLKQITEDDFRNAFKTDT